MDLQKGIDICICTFNRASYLQQCIEKLIPQLSHEDVSLTVIDNNSTDETAVVVQSFGERNIPLRYFFEPAQGISEARNRGWEECQHEWIFYIDDECVAGPELIQKAFNCIADHPDVAVMGGPIYPIHISGVPTWLPDGFGQFELPYSRFTEINDKYLRCGCFLVRRKVLQEAGGFNINLGMKGYNLAYAEELELQDRLRKAGYKTGYAPELRIGHQVRPEKLNMQWILQSEFARRRDKMSFDPLAKNEAAFNLIRTLIGRIIWTPIHLTKVLTNKKYTIQHAVMDSLRPLAFRLGELVGTFKRTGKTLPK